MTAYLPAGPNLSNKRGWLRRRWGWWAGAIAICVLAAGAYIFFAKSGQAQSGTAKSGQAQSTGGKPGQNAGARSVPVAATAAKTGDVGVYLSGLGSVTPLNTVTVKSRVDGQLMRVLFREGQLVRAGDLLAEIDPRPFQVQLDQAQGQLERDQALLKNARLDLERYKVLVDQDSIPKQQLDTQGSLVTQYEGAVKVDQSAIDNAKLQIIYSRITAPISGRLGLRLVDAGNMVHATDTTGLVVITQLQPITVIFTIPEDSLPQVLKKLRAGEKLTVDAYDREQKVKLATGSLLTVDNQIDQTTGTVRLKAIFDNDDAALFPNQFVNARLLLDVKKGAVVVPSVAIQRGTQGAFVYVIDQEQTAAARPVKVGATQGDDASVEGVKPGEMVVVDGADKLRDGAKVEIQTGEAAAAPHKKGKS
jgi:multidrug efflux system membrane fusion protein